MAESTRDAMRFIKEDPELRFSHTLGEREEYVLKYSKEDKGWVCTHYKKLFGNYLRAETLDTIPDCYWDWDSGDGSRETNLGDEPSTIKDLLSLEIDIHEICRYAKDFLGHHLQDHNRRNVKESIARMNVGGYLHKAVRVFNEGVDKIVEQKIQLSYFLDEKEDYTLTELVQYVSPDQIVHYAYNYLDKYELPAITKAGQEIGINEDYLSTFTHRPYSHYPLQQKAIIRLYLDQHNKSEILRKFGSC